MANELHKLALSPAQLRPVCDLTPLDGRLSSELEPIQTLVGQDRALQAISFGTGIRHRGYNMFVLGPEGSGRHSAIAQLLAEKSVGTQQPDDWAYIHNFETEWKPNALRLPAGTAQRYQNTVLQMLDDLRSAIPALFEGEDYLDQRKKIDDHFQREQERAFEALQQKAAAESIGVLRTPMGFALAPIRDGNVIKPEVFNALPEAEREALQETIAGLQEELNEILKHIPEMEKQRRDQIRKLNAERAKIVVDAAIEASGRPFSDVPAIQEHLAIVAKDMVDNIDLFMVANPVPQEQAAAGGASAPQKLSVGIEADRRFTKYMVNAVVRHDPDEDGNTVPIIYEDHPTLARLVGRIEHKAHMGALITDFTMIRPGALHRANGGYLILDAHRLLREPWSWDALKRALRSQSLSITSTTEQLNVMSITSLDPEPIPLDVKVVIIGDRTLYYMLAQYDPDFTDLFKVQVDFDEEIERTEDSIHLFARLIGTLGAQRGLRPMDCSAIGAIIDEATRLADDAERMTLKIGRLGDLLSEADHWAAEQSRDTVTADDVNRAIREQIFRADRIREKSHESIKRDIMMIDTDGSRTGQINGLSVIGIGNFSFGRPARITARVRMGTGKVIDIEREIALGGPLHAKGVLILSSYLAANYATQVPISLWASLVFEQSYGGIDGDSASSTELYALLSALADVPIWQGYAVTGSVNQLGEVQAIGGVNQKIEGFFDICAHRGLTGKQGVLIPKANLAHLVLRDRVIEAVQAGKFNIFAVSTIDEGIEILTGKAAGQRGPDGRYPEGSINALVEAKLEAFAEMRKSFAAKDANKDGDHD